MNTINLLLQPLELEPENSSRLYLRRRNSSESSTTVVASAHDNQERADTNPIESFNTQEPFSPEPQVFSGSEPAEPSINFFDQEPPSPTSPMSASAGADTFGVPTPATTVAATGDNNIDGLLSGVKWTSTSVSFSFTDSIGDYEAGYSDLAAHGASFQTLNATQRNVAREWIGSGGEYYNVSGLSPFELSGASDRDATIRMAMSDVPGTAFAYYPNSSFVEGGDAWFNRIYYNSPVIGNYAYHTFGHELGHALGLKHGQELGGPANVAMNPDRDSMEFSIMTYRSYVGHDLVALPYYTNETWGFAQSLMMYDIRAIQQMYGAWFGYNSTNTTYTFSTTTGEMFVNGFGQGTPGANRIFRTIWDGAGIDTYDFSNYTTNLSIDLSPGGWSDLDVGGTFQKALLNAGYGGITQYARGHVFNALQYNGNPSSLIENANGGSGNDSMLGNIANNVLYGNGGNDTIDGGDGDDLIYLGDGNDYVNVLSGGNDTFYGGNGNDYIYGASGNELYYGEAGNDTLLGYYGNDIIDGGTENDYIDGGSGNDTVNGGDGDDLIYLGDGDDYVNSVALGNDTFYGGNGNDFIFGASGNELYYGEAGNDTLWGYFGNDTINGGTGADALDGGDNIDTLSYANSSAAVTVNLATNTVSGGDATGDTIINFENVTGSSFNDVLTGSSANNTIDGGSGNDTVNGGDGDDLIYLGDGDDYVNSVALGNDTFYGGNGNDFIFGASGNELYYGEAGNDTLWGYFGNDTINGGTGADALDGGDNIDTLSYANSSAAVTVNLATNTVSGGDATGDTIINFENVTGSSFNDVLTGSIAINTLDGGAGNDTLDGGAGFDFLDGGTGTDTATYASFSGKINANLATGIVTSPPTPGTETLVNIENVIGATGNDTITGNTGNNRLEGGAGNDLINGGDGIDSLFGGAGNDTLDGGTGFDSIDGGTGTDTATYASFSGKINANLATGIVTSPPTPGSETLVSIENLIGATGNDTLTGNSGNNNLNGGAGNDSLTGGLGKDTLTGGTGTGIDKFFYNNLADSLFSNFDIVTDFNANVGGDKLINSVARAGFSNVGAIASLDTVAIGAALTVANFAANFAATFTFGAQRFVAINNGIADYASATDAIIEVTGLAGTLDITDFAIA